MPMALCLAHCFIFGSTSVGFLGPLPSEKGTTEKVSKTFA